MPKPLVIFQAFPPAGDEWKLADALCQAEMPCAVKRVDRRTVKIAPKCPEAPAVIRAFVAGWVAGAMES